MLVFENRHIGKVRGLRGEEVFLLPGQLYFGTGVASVRTLLGSCVAITLWHPQTGHGGMCHYLLPERQRMKDGSRDGKYGDEALEQLVEAMDRSGTDPRDYQAQVYGGADTMPGEGPKTGPVGARPKIGERNVEKAWMLVDHYGFQLDSVDVGGNEPRLVLLDMGSGLVEMRRGGHARRRRDAGHGGAMRADGEDREAPPVRAAARATDRASDRAMAGGTGVARRLDTAGAQR